MYRGALKLSELQNRLDVAEGFTEREVHDEYHRLLEEFPENHTVADYRMFRLNHPQDFRFNSIEKVLVWIRWNWAARRAWILLALISCVLAIVLAIL